MIWGTEDAALTGHRRTLGSIREMLRLVALARPSLPRGCIRVLVAPCRRVRGRVGAVDLSRVNPHRRRTCCVRY